MKKYENWGHVYGIIFNKFIYDNLIKAIKESQVKKETYTIENKENEVAFISKYEETDNSHIFLIGRTNEEVSKTKFDTKTFSSKDIDFDENEHISDYTHIAISKTNISEKENSYYLLLEKNQRIQIGTIKKLIGGIIGYKSLEHKDTSKLYIGSIIISDYIKKLFNHEIIGKSIIINEINQNIIDFPDNEEEGTFTKTTQISKYKKSTNFLKALDYLINDFKNDKAKKEVFLEVDDGKNKNKKIPLDEYSTKYVPFFQLPFYIKSINKNINQNIVEKFNYVLLNNDYESL